MNKGKITVSVRLNQDLYKKIIKAAHKDARPISSWIRVQLQKILEKKEKDE